MDGPRRIIVITTCITRIGVGKTPFGYRDKPFISAEWINPVGSIGDEAHDWR
jgi:hypothetical protein